jgi:hypothetical protein
MLKFLVLLKIFITLIMVAYLVIISHSLPKESQLLRIPTPFSMDLGRDSEEKKEKFII